MNIWKKNIYLSLAKKIRIRIHFRMKSGIRIRIKMFRIRHTALAIHIFHKFQGAKWNFKFFLVYCNISITLEKIESLTKIRVGIFLFLKSLLYQKMGLQHLKITHIKLNYLQNLERKKEKNSNYEIWAKIFFGKKVPI